MHRLTLIFNYGEKDTYKKNEIWHNTVIFYSIQYVNFTLRKMAKGKNINSIFLWSHIRGAKTTTVAKEVSGDCGKTRGGGPNGKDT